MGPALRGWRAPGRGTRGALEERDDTLPSGAPGELDLASVRLEVPPLHAAPKPWKRCGGLKFTRLIDDGTGTPAEVEFSHPIPFIFPVNRLSLL